MGGNPTAEPPLPSRTISQGLTLGVFVVLVPTALLFVLARTPALDLQWESFPFRTFLMTSTGLLSAIISAWLHFDARKHHQPVLEVLSAGFAWEAALVGSFGWLHSPGQLAWYASMFGMWPLIAGAAAVLFLYSRRLDAAGRATVRERPWVFWIAATAAFAAMAAACALFAFAPNLLVRGARRFSPQIGIACLLGLGVVLALTFLYYLRDRKPVALAATLAIFLLVLSEVTALASPAWRTLWWYAQILHFSSLFLAAYGMQEHNRAAEREVLIARLGSLSQRLEELSIRDPLTECYNRRFAEETLDAEYRRGGRTGLPLTLLVIDADNFKRVNDSYGHLCGDKVLIELASRIRHVLRASDVLARCGGEEFWVVLPHTNRAGGALVAQKILHTVKGTPIAYEGTHLYITVSIGFADTLSPAINSARDLVQVADRALYKAKREGKDRAATLDPLSFRIPTPQA